MNIKYFADDDVDDDDVDNAQNNSSLSMVSGGIQCREIPNLNIVNNMNNM